MNTYIVTIKTVIEAPDADEAVQQVLAHGVPFDAAFEVLEAEENAAKVL